MTNLLPTVSDINNIVNIHVELPLTAYFVVLTVCLECIKTPAIDHFHMTSSNYKVQN